MFFTQVELNKNDLEIDYKSKIITIGSCFSDNIGEKLSNAFFDIKTNPLGVLYNPISVKNGLELLMNTYLFKEDDLFEHNSLWNSFSHSSFFSHEDKLTTLNSINSTLSTTRAFFQETNFLFITFGTAWVFEEKETRKIVSNCHKLPSSYFRRYRLSINEIVEQYNVLLEKIHSKFPKLQIVFTVSPIRHWKDGANENTLSKSTLQLTINELQKKFSFVHYFPAYEIMLDELRDYRFYKSDMIHPNQVAIDYLWERFGYLYFSQKTENLKKELEKFRKMLEHRPRNKNITEYQLLLEKIEQKKNNLIERYPFLKERLIKSGT